MVTRLKNYLANDGARAVFLLMWAATNAILFYFTFLYYYYGPQFYYLHQMLGYGLCISRATAACINLNACVILLPMCRNITRVIRGYRLTCRVLRRLLDKSKSFHIACGYMLCIMAAIHCGAHVFNSINFSKHFNKRYGEINVASFSNQHPIILIMTSVPGITGISMAILLCMITYSASSSSRRANYRRFWKIHHLFILFYILLLLHACSGVLKYQTNISEHIPGCFVGFNSDDPNGTVFVAEPEPEPEGNPRLSGDMVVVPELGPIPEGEYFGHSSEESESVPNYVPCRQPEPKFKSCATEAWIWMLIPLTLYIIERGTRLFGKSASTTKIVEHPNDVLEIEFFNKSIAAEPGQSIWIRCPSVSSIESHPFTLTSVPTKHHPYFTIHMAVTGEWTGKVKDLFTNHGVKRANSSRSYSERQDSVELFPKALLNCEDTVYNQTHNRTISTAKVEQSADVKIAIVNGALETSSSEIMHQPRFYVDGPYGTPMQDIFRYSTSVCVAGGIGITPYAAVLNMIRFNYNLLEKRKLRRIYLIWTCRSVSSFEWFIDLINAVQSLLWNRNRPDFLNVYLHVTSADFGEMRCLSEKYPSLSRCRLQAGRPQFKDMFRELSERHQRSTIGVFCCGSKSLNNAVREHCLRTKSKTRANFVFNKESF